MNTILICLLVAAATLSGYYVGVREHAECNIIYFRGVLP